MENLNVKRIIEDPENNLTVHHEKALLFLDELIGLNHVFGNYGTTGWDSSGRVTICTKNHNEYSTFDFDKMTQAVLLAHKMKIRFTIKPATGDKLRLFIEPDEKHPDLIALIDKAIKMNGGY